MTNSVEIGWQIQISTETRPWSIDMAAEMDPGDEIVSATASLTDLLTGADFPDGLSGSVGRAGTVVTQTTLGLVGGHSYRLVVTANMGGGKETATVLLLRVPY